MNDSERNRFIARITKINIGSGSALNHTGTTWNIGCNVDLGAMGNYMYDIVAQIQKSDTIRLATHGDRHAPFFHSVPA
jgi:hypothetical protein